MIYSISADNYRLNIIILLCQLFLLINRFHLLLKSGVLFDFANHYYAAALVHCHCFVQMLWHCIGSNDLYILVCHLGQFHLQSQWIFPNDGGNYKW